MLSGMFPASAGDAFVGGYHIQSETDAVRNSIGICPQLDTLWPSLTGEAYILSTFTFNEQYLRTAVYAKCDRVFCLRYVTR